MTDTNPEILTTVNAPVAVEAYKVRDQIENWLEGGDTWGCVLRKELPEGTTKDDFRAGGKFNPECCAGFAHPMLAVIPTVPGGRLVIRVDENDDGSETKEYVLDTEAIRQGLQVMATTYTKHFNDMMGENGDVITSSVFVQCCLFREVVFG